MLLNIKFNWYTVKNVPVHKEHFNYEIMSLLEDYSYDIADFFSAYMASNMQNWRG